MNHPQLPPSEDLVSVIRAIIRHELAQQSLPTLAEVSAVRERAAEADPANHDCSVKLLGGDGREYDQVPICTAMIGALVAPRVGDIVLLQFINGDAQQPVITGSLYDDKQRIPLHGAEEFALRLPADSKEDEGLHLQATALEGGRYTLRIGAMSTLMVDKERLHLCHDKIEVIIDGGEKSLLLTDGESSVSLGGDGSMALSASGDLQIEAKGSIAIKAAANLDLEGSSATTLKGATVDIN